MNKQESERKKSPAEGKEDSERKEILEVNKPPRANEKVAVEKQPQVYKTDIAARLDAVLKGAKPVNRSSDLVPLSHEFDQMRKQLRSLVASAKEYHTARVQVEKARMEVRAL
jgi:hypothetical protein